MSYMKKLNNNINYQIKKISLELEGGTLYAEKIAYFLGAIDSMKRITEATGVKDTEVLKALSQLSFKFKDVAKKFDQTNP